MQLNDIQWVTHALVFSRTASQAGPRETPMESLKLKLPTDVEHGNCTMRIPDKFAKHTARMGAPKAKRNLGNAYKTEKV